MSAREKVSAQQITNALLKWRGKITPAAEELGIARNSLMRRIGSLGLNLTGFRSLGMGGTPMPPTRRITPMPTLPSFAQTDSLGPKNERATFTGPATRPTIPPVSSAVAEFPATRKRQTPRIPPNYLDKLTDAKYDLQALLRRDVTEQQILEECLDECLDGWIARKIASVRQPGPEQPAERPGRRGRNNREKR